MAGLTASDLNMETGPNMEMLGQLHQQDNFCGKTIWKASLGENVKLKQILGKDCKGSDEH
jgi:hypothetical protein